ncbi:MAG: hypothetical protein ICV74_10190, partial [Thermoleophilia bacterium]|nr:hypothetical protein [Thermoleophilia bacterium]
MSSERANELDALVAGLPAAERDRARAADRLLRSVPAPPPRVPDRLARAVAGIPAAHEGERARRRRLTALAFAAVVAALAFGAGTRVAGDGFDARRAIAMRPTVNAPGASAVIRLGAPDGSGNWALRLEVEGLPKLPEDGYYVLWLARGREYGATCGSFSVGRRE